MTVAAAYQQLMESLLSCYDRGEATSIARIVLEDAFGIRNPRRKDALAPHQLHRLAQIEARLLAMEPVQYILGTADFYGLKFKVTPAVLIPRPETEELVHWILEEWNDAAEHPVNPSLLDIGTGSGCIPIVVKKKRPHWQITGVDISDEALRVARENGAMHAVSIGWRKIDILDRSQWADLDSFQIIVSNPPYIPRSESELMPATVRHYEPSLALFVDDDDPLLFYRTIAEFATLHLVAGGQLYFEINEYRASEVMALLENLPFHEVILRPDLQGKPRMIKASI